MTTPDERRYVSHDESEALITRLERSAAGLDPSGRAGIFGPASETWKINRESALFLAAGRAALLQLAHPWVTTALQQHSKVIERPISRFHSTFRIVFTMVFGSLAQAAAAARSLYQVHTYIQGETREEVGRWPSGSRYQANELAALRWVHATLIESAVLAYETVLPPLTSAELDAYYAETKKLAALFSLSADALPPNWQSFLAYCREMEESDSLGVTDAARRMAHSLLRGAHAWIKPPHWYRALTTALLPERFRSGFDLPFGAEEEHAVCATRRRFPRIYRRLPASMRFVGPWHEAQARLAGRAPGPITRASNQFWMGEARMPFTS